MGDGCLVGAQSRAIPWVAPGDLWTPQSRGSPSLIVPLIIPWADPWLLEMALPSDGSHSIQFSAMQWHRWHAGTVWPGVNDSSCRLKQPKPAAYLPTSAPGRRRELGQEAIIWARQRGAAAGNQGLSGQFLGERPPPRALSSQTALTRRVLAPATPDTRTKERCQFLN